MVFEPLYETSLYELLAHPFFQLNQETFWQIATDIACGLVGLYKENIIYNDLRMCNIFLNEKRRAKILTSKLGTVLSKSFDSSLLCKGML